MRYDSSRGLQLSSQIRSDSVERIGDINDLIVTSDQTGRSWSAIVGVGGFLGMTPAPGRAVNV
jgi:hypothetical protein